MEQVQPETDDQESATPDYYSGHNKYAAGAHSQVYRDPSIAWSRDRNGALVPDKDDYYSGHSKEGELWLAPCTCCHAECANRLQPTSCAACMVKSLPSQPCSTRCDGQLVQQRCMGKTKSASNECISSITPVVRLPSLKA